MTGTRWAIAIALFVCGCGDSLEGVYTGGGREVIAISGQSPIGASYRTVTVAQIEGDEMEVRLGETCRLRGPATGNSISLGTWGTDTCRFTAGGRTFAPTTLIGNAERTAEAFSLSLTGTVENTSDRAESGSYQLLFTGTAP
jgi:hypothetical protein